MTPQGEMKKKPVVLVVTTGQTDLQVLVKHGEKYFRSSVGREGIRNFHKALLNGQQSYKIYLEGINEPEVKRNQELEWLHDGGLCSKDKAVEPVYRDGKLLLIPAKLGPVLNELDNTQNLQIHAAILLTTKRDEDKVKSHRITEGEPIAVGPILTTWLAERYSLIKSEDGKPDWGKAVWVDILKKGMVTPNAHRAAVKRIEYALRAFLKWGHDLDHEAEIHLALNSGMKEFDAPITACARYYFRERARFCKVSQFDPQAVDREPPPDQSYRARQQADILIHRGEFAVAYGVATGFEYSQTDATWVKRLKDVADYFAGRKVSDDAANYLKPMLGDAVPICLLVAMRIEAALWRGDFLSAVSNTVTFTEAAILDGINTQLPKNSHVDVIMEKIIYQANHQKTLNSLVAELQKIHCKNNRQPPLPLQASESKSGKKSAFLVRKSGAAFDTWLDFIDGNFRESLKKYNQALSTKVNIQKPSNYYFLQPRKLRNVSSHGIIDQKTNQLIHEVYSKAGLWDMQSCLPGSRFLSVPLTSRVLQACGIEDPGRLYQDLVEGLSMDLFNHDILTGMIDPKSIQV